MAHVVSVSPARRAPALEDLIALDDAHGTAGPRTPHSSSNCWPTGRSSGETERALTELCLRAAISRSAPLTSRSPTRARRRAP